MINPITNRIYYQIEVMVDSPISVSSGEDLYTDSDVLSNGNGEYFIPGTSLCGAFRNYLGKKKNENGLFGFSDSDGGKMSSIFVSDLYFNQAVTKSVRDGVALDEEKTVENKFDMEIIEPGVSGNILLEVVIREKQGNDEDYNSQVNTVIRALQNGEIRIGSNKNRGFGRLSVKGIKKKCFNRDDADEWIDYCKTGKLPGEKETFEEWSKKNAEESGNQFVKVRVPLRLRGGISIRKYSAEPGKADYSHITCNGKPVVPGSSWNGAIRADAVRILKQLGYSNPQITYKFINDGKEVEEKKNLLDLWFGYVSLYETDAMQSLLVISESVLADAMDETKNARELPMTRNSVDRFTAAAGALYSEIACFDGRTILEFMVRKDDRKKYKALLGLMMLITEDIEKGYVAVGGQTSIGRGIFSKDENKSIEYSEETDRKECLEELYQVLKEGEKYETR